MQFDREQQHEHGRYDEYRNRNAGHRDGHYDSVRHGVLSQRGHDAGADADDDRKQHRQGADFQRQRKCAANQLADCVIAIPIRRTEVTPDDARQIPPELLRQRFVQVIVSCNVGRNLRRQNTFVVKRASRRGMHQKKREHDDQQQCRYRPQQPEQRVSQQSIDPMWARCSIARAEIQVLTVLIMQIIVSPTGKLRAGEMLGHEKIQRHDRGSRQQ